MSKRLIPFLFVLLALSAASANAAPPSDYLTLDVSGARVLRLSPDRELFLQEGDTLTRLGLTALDAKFLTTDDLLLVDTQLALQKFSLTSSHLAFLTSANAPLFLSPDRTQVAYLKPKDFESVEDGLPVPLTNGIAVLNLATGEEQELFEWSDVTTHLYGWGDAENLIVEVPYWSPVTMKPAERLTLGRLPVLNGKQTRLTAWASLPALAPEAAQPRPDFAGDYLTYQSRAGVVIASLREPRYTLQPQANDPRWEAAGLTAEQEGTRAPLAFPADPHWVNATTTGDVPLPQTRLTTYQIPSQVSAPNEPYLFYRPVSATITVSAYFDLDPTPGWIRDWTGIITNTWVYGHAYDGHKGTDYATRIAEVPVHPSALGTVYQVTVECGNGSNLSFGTHVRIDHGPLSDGNTYRTIYGHLRCDSTLPGLGTVISSLQQPLGILGNTGNSTGPHTHLEVRRNGENAIDPYDLHLISDTLPALSTGGLAGIIKDTLGAPVPNAEVKISAGGEYGKATTDSSGTYSFVGVPAGAALIEAQFAQRYNSFIANVSPDQNLTASDLVLPDCAPPSAPGCAQVGWDNGVYIADVSFPDEIVATPGEPLLKSWRIKNTGHTTWGAGYQLVFINGDALGEVSSVAVPETPPGAVIDLAVPMIASGVSSRSHWRMRNPQGVYFGDTYWAHVNVRPPGAHLMPLTVDPPSPANTDRVQVVARVTDLADFRALRLKINNVVMAETTDTELIYEWDTAGYATLGHSLVVEAARLNDPLWRDPETRGLVYFLQGTTAQVNHPPHLSQLSSPADLSIGFDPTTTLCAQGFDLDGDALYYQFELSTPTIISNSDWLNTACAIFDTPEFGAYRWRAKVKDPTQAESDWSALHRFDVVSSTLGLDQLTVEAVSDDQTRVLACATSSGEAHLSLRVNATNDGSDSGVWEVLTDSVSACLDQTTAPVWNTAAYADGPHLVRAIATVFSPTVQSVLSDTIYNLGARLPLTPVVYSPARFFNTLAVDFQWAGQRATTYTVFVSQVLTPTLTPLLQQTLTGLTTTLTFTQDQPALYWQVVAENISGTRASAVQSFGVDRVAPICAVNITTTTTDSPAFNVLWGGTDASSGIAAYEVAYLDTGRGAWRTWLVGTPLISALFGGQVGHVYTFRCRATDQAGNVGAWQVGPAVHVSPAGGTPDLVIEQLASYPDPNGGLIAVATIRNQGSGATPGGFYTDLYLNRVPTGTQDFNSNFIWVSEPLAAGAAVKLARRFVPTASNYNVTLYAQVDTAGTVAEANDGNNIWSAAVTGCVGKQDAYEDDDAWQAARALVSGDTQDHGFDGLGDHDWFKIVTQPMAFYTLTALAVTSNVDPRLTLYDATGQTLLASSDDDNGLNPRLTWQSPGFGPVYVAAEPWSTNAGGCDNLSYSLSLGSSGGAPIFPLYLPLAQK